MADGDTMISGQNNGISIALISIRLFCRLFEEHFVISMFVGFPVSPMYSVPDGMVDWVA